MALIDNGDGTFTTEDGIRIANPYGRGSVGGEQPAPLMPDDQPDERMAQMIPLQMGSGDQNPLGPSKAVADVVGAMTGGGDPEKLREIQNRNRLPGTPEIPPEPPASKNKLVLGDQDITSDEGDGTVDPKDRIQAQGAGIAMGLGPGAISPLRVIDKGGMKETARSTVKGAKLPDELQTQADANIEAHKAANQTALGAQQDVNVENFSAAVGRQAQVERQAAEEKIAADRHNQVMQDAMGKFDAMAKDAREKPVNQDTYWEEKGWGAHALAGLYVAMYEVAKRPGEKNEAKDIIDKQIDQWINDRKERREQGVANQRTAIGQMREQFQSESAQRAGLRAQAYEAYQGKLQTIAAGAATEKEKAAAMEVNANLEDKKQAEREKAALLEADHVTSHEQLVKPTVVGGGNAPFAKNDSSFVDIEKPSTANPNGISLKASDAGMANQWRQQIDAIEQTKNHVAEAKELLKHPSVENSARVQILLNNIATSSAAAQLGSNRQTGMGELNEVGQILGQHGTFTSDMLGRTSKALDAMNASAQAAKNRIMQSAPVYSAPNPTPTGDLVRYQMFPNGNGGQVPIAFTAVGKKKARNRK